MILMEHVPLAPLTTLGVGGPARYFCELNTRADVFEAVDFARSRQLPLFVLGGGSNLLVADAGFPGLVVKINLRGIKQSELEQGWVAFEVAAGEDWDAFVARTVDANCAGLECLSGIPGTTGGAPVQNVGAYGQEVANCIRYVDTFALSENTACFANYRCILSNEQCKFGYRSSRFNSEDRGAFLILKVRFELELGGKPTLRYPELQSYFAGRTKEPTLAEVRAAVREIRHRKAMLLVPGDVDVHSAGSFFKNPVVPKKRFEALDELARNRGLEMPNYPADEELRKLSAAWLVEQAGFHKGYQRGAVGISTRHALAIVNRGGAKAAEIVALADEIKSRVLGEFGIELVLEPVFVGF